MENYYNILNISKTADEAQIKHAYRNLAMQYHPDKNPGNKAAEERFKKITEAYSILSDPQKRKDYDLSMSNSFGSYSYNYNENSNPFEEDIFSFRWKEYGKNSEQRKSSKITRKEAFKILINGIILTIAGILFFRSVLFLGIFGLLLALSLISEGIIRIRKGYTAIFD